MSNQEPFYLVRDRMSVKVSLHQQLAAKPDNFEQTEQTTKEPISDERKEAEKAFFNPVGAQTPDEVIGAAPAPTAASSKKKVLAPAEAWPLPTKAA